MYQVKKSFLKMIFLMSLILLTLLGCANSMSTSESSGTWADGFGYQYLAPKVYCHDVGISVGFELYCPEGRIEVGFEIPAENMTLNDFLLTKLSNDVDEYQIRLINPSGTDTPGKPSPVLVASLINTSNYSIKPTYIAVVEVGARYSYLYGFAYREDFIPDLNVYFLKIALSLEPFELEK